MLAHLALCANLDGCGGTNVNEDNPEKLDRPKRWLCQN